MTLNRRQLAMLQTVREYGAIKTEALAGRFNTTLQTVRWPANCFTTRRSGS